MKSRLPRLLLPLCLLACGAYASAQTRPAAASDTELLTNASIVKLVRAGFSEKTIITIIRTRPARFDLAPDRLIDLKKRGVGEKIILAMLARDGGEQFAADDSVGDFDSDPFFAGINRPAQQSGAQTAPGGSDPGEVNIFGSSGDARGRTRTNGTNGSASGETQTNGSATVRILRPPAEAGGAPPKLERTPTLTNESVVELIAAGFSEGTIIRRIENSPADFDLAPAKLAELRRRRVPEAVIAAMRAAMSDDPASGGGDAPHPQR
jgi:hypothetical protein